MSLLIFTLTLFMFALSINQSGHNPAPSMRLFYFKAIKLVNGQVSTFGDGVGSPLVSRQYLTLCCMSKTKEAQMPKSKTPSNELLDKLSILEIAVEVSMAKLQTQLPNNSLIIHGIENAYNDFKKELTKYISATEIWPTNHSKLKTAQRQIGLEYNIMLNEVISCVNIVPKKGDFIC